MKIALAALTLAVSILGCSGSSPKSETDPSVADVENSDVPRAAKAEESADGRPEFQALTLFAKHDYTQAAQIIRGLGISYQCWHQSSMNEFYDDPDAYAKQLGTLEKFVRANPRMADAHFLLAYHYMKNGDSEAAANEMQKVVTLKPDDRLAGGLLKLIQRTFKSAPVAEENPFPNRDLESDSPVIVGDGKSKPVHVKGYRRKDGSYVEGYDRSRPHHR